jgi:hypothetical protein
MLVRIYWSTWALVALAAGVLFAAGMFTMVTVVVFGFIAFGLTFMGMMNVLPGTVAHPETPKPVKAERELIEATRQPAVETFRILKSA